MMVEHLSPDRGSSHLFYSLHFLIAAVIIVHVNNLQPFLFPVTTTLFLFARAALTLCTRHVNYYAALP